MVTGNVIGIAANATPLILVVFSFSAALWISYNMGYKRGEAVTLAHVVKLLDEAINRKKELVEE